MQEKNAPARLLVDTRIFGGSVTGVVRYLSNLLREIQLLEPSDLKFNALCSPAQDLPCEIPKIEMHGVGAHSKPLGVLQQVVLPRAVRNAQCDLFHYPYFDPPRITSCPFIATCYDIEPLRHPELFPRRIVWYYKVFAPRLRTAGRVVVISQNTGKDIIELLGVHPDRVKVVYLGVDPHFHPIREEDRVNAVRLRYGLPSRYLLYLGNTMPHKNLVRLVQAMAIVRKRFPSVPLLLAGREDKYRPAVEQAIAVATLSETIRFIGDIAEEDLPALLSSAAVFVYPSLYEGFGLPVLEAMACGTPVVVSNRSSLPEIVGNSAISVDPYDVFALAEAITHLLANPAGAKRFSDLGRERAKEFTWRRCAEEHLAVYREVLNR